MVHHVTVFICIFIVGPQYARQKKISARRALHLTCERPNETGSPEPTVSLLADVAAVCRSGYYQLRQLGLSGRRLLSECASKTLVQAFVSCRLDNCYSLFVGISDGLMSRLQSVQNAAARLFTGTRRCDHNLCDRSRTAFRVGCPDGTGSCPNNCNNLRVREHSIFDRVFGAAPTSTPITLSVPSVCVYLFICLYSLLAAAAIYCLCVFTAHVSVFIQPLCRSLFVPINYDDDDERSSTISDSCSIYGCLVPLGLVLCCLQQRVVCVRARRSWFSSTESALSHALNLYKQQSCSICYVLTDSRSSSRYE